MTQVPDLPPVARMKDPPPMPGGPVFGSEQSHASCIQERICASTVHPVSSIEPSHKTLCVRTALPVPVRDTFLYSVPECLREATRVGCRVLVPFHRRQVAGYVLEVLHRSMDRDLKELIDVLDPEPQYPEKMVPFFEWIADYYLHPVGRVIQLALPEAAVRCASLTPRGEALVRGSLLSSKELEMLRWIRDHPANPVRWPLRELLPLHEKGWIRMETRAAKGTVRNPYESAFIRPRPGITMEAALGKRGRSSAKNEIEFLTDVFVAGSLPLNDVRQKFKNGGYLVEKWIQKGVIEIQRLSVSRGWDGHMGTPAGPPPHLNAYQEEALQQISVFLDAGTFSCCLLYGVTGSGKTEVYYRAVEHVLDLGRQALILVPEIALTGSLEVLFRSRLGDRVALYHSRMTHAERRYEWMRMIRGEADVVIGARSAVFAPLPRLGLIIVDEEHDTAYVQEERRGGPHYHARDAAVVRAKLENALILLGTGTPSVQSYQNALAGKYQLLTMPERVEQRPLPEVEIVDMKDQRDGLGRREMVSARLVRAIEETLGLGNQAILFLNRRGFYRLYLCRACGRAVSCPNCDVGLTYHLQEDRLICHYCGYCCTTDVHCAACGHSRFRAIGFGTEKLESELHALFPKAGIARMDADVTRKKGEASRILRQFARRETDILVGTQMITKGHDFPHVTLVGVISAELSLSFPDFRAGERTFQLLSQVAGRAGRGPQKGKVIIQTFNPDHPVIRSAVAHDFQAFFEREQSLRRALGYPPSSNLACLRLQGNSQAGTEAAAGRLATDFLAILKGWPTWGKEIQVLGPVRAPIGRLKGKERWQFLIKSGNGSLLRHFLREIERSSRWLRTEGVHLGVDVDPYEML